MPNKERC